MIEIEGYLSVVERRRLFQLEDYLAAKKYPGMNSMCRRLKAREKTVSYQLCIPLIRRAIQRPFAQSAFSTAKDASNSRQGFSTLFG